MSDALSLTFYLLAYMQYIAVVVVVVVVVYLCSLEFSIEEDSNAGLMVL